MTALKRQLSGWGTWIAAVALIAIWLGPAIAARYPGWIPTPGPTPAAAPLEGAGFRALIIEERSARRSLSPDQLAILQSALIREYLEAHCASEAGAKCWAIWDKDTEATHAPAWLRAALAKYVPTVTAGGPLAVPYLVVSDGKTGAIGPLPGSVAETLAILKKYGGP